MSFLYSRRDSDHAVQINSQLRGKAAVSIMLSSVLRVQWG